MRKFCKFIFICALYFCLHIYSYDAKADTVNEFVQVQCLEDLNALRIDVFSANGKIAKKNAKDNPKALWEKHGIKDIRSMVGYVHLVDGDGTPSKDPRDIRMVVANPIQTSCALTEELADGSQVPRTYDIHIEPYFFNTNPNGYCGGGSPTVELTLTSGKEVLIDHLRFVSECSSDGWHQHNKGMAMGSIQSVQLNPEDRYISLYGGLDERYEDDFVFTSTFWFDEDLPITHEKVYGNRKENK